ncbi:hypothetical protein [Goodfellowiella coeruleoviolacea]|uniref:Uncharacterized protein n=1 Tax=Goodfellowiella coeruleoviolacea TaxID=334858 RepID=A0AAE3KF93_9PSEU|nr:hypothetical protein [Goodfellowiella coeruleoviolacea]MCP2164737.1 hypothetical protein [Goodfellowiella coeruleoviolacea]
MQLSRLPLPPVSVGAAIAVVLGLALGVTFGNQPTEVDKEGAPERPGITDASSQQDDASGAGQPMEYVPETVTVTVTPSAPASGERRGSGQSRATSTPATRAKTSAETRPNREMPAKPAQPAAPQHSAIKPVPPSDVPNVPGSLGPSLPASISLLPSLGDPGQGLAENLLGLRDQILR